MSAMLALALLNYGVFAFAPAHVEQHPVPPAAGINLRIDAPRSHHHHSNGVLHVHAASPFVAASTSAFDATQRASSVSYLRLQAARIETRANAPPRRPPRIDL